jgi:hypothetical protein
MPSAWRSEGITSVDMAEAAEHWFKLKAIPGVRFALNEPVLITAGPFKGQAGSTISLLKLSPEPEYLVELAATGQDVHALQSELGTA